MTTSQFDGTLWGESAPSQNPDTDAWPKLLLLLLFTRVFPT